MKVILVAILAVLAVSVTAIDPEDADKKFREYLDQFKIRVQRSGQGYEEKKQNFLNTLKTIEENNQNKSSGYELGLNQYAHLSYDEFINTRTGFIPPPDDEEDSSRVAYNSSRRARAAAPASWDWRNRYGVIRPIQNQGGCGSCWVFAGIAAIEGQMSLKYGNHEKISEQEPLECIRKYSTRGCGGGWSTEVFNWDNSVGGVASANGRPYKGVDSTPCQTSINARSRGSRTTGAYNFINGENEAAMKEALYNNGPMHVAIHATGDFMYLRGGVYNDAKNQCANQGVNHAVLLVGYGTENGQDYWLIRNSWGTGWGVGGYGKMSRGRKLCRIAQYPFWPILA